MTGEESLNVAREKLEDAVKQGNLTKDLQRFLAEIKSVLKLYNEL